MDTNTLQLQKAKLKERKKRVEEAIAKYEDRKEQSQEPRKISFKSPSKKDVALVVAFLLGILRAKLILKVNSEVNKALQRFINTCPPPQTLARVVKVKDNLKKALDSYEKSVRTFSTIAAGLNASISIVRTLLKIRFADPKPTTVGGASVTIGVLNLNSDKIYKLNKRLDEYTEQVATISALGIIAQSINTPIREKIDILDSYIERCTLQDESNIDKNFSEVVQQPTQQPAQQGTTTPPGVEFYRNYKLSIVNDPDSPTIAPRRYAIAQDNQGVVVLRGQSSFSSDTQILLDELKFRIDNKLA